MVAAGRRCPRGGSPLLRAVPVRYNSGMSGEPTFDCAVIGGGPAGSSLAAMLARRGVSTLLLDEGRRLSPAPLETLLAGAEPALRGAGVWGDVADAAQVDVRRHGAIWGSDELRWRTDAVPGLVLRRGAFDAALRRVAARSGARCIEAARLRGPLPVQGAGRIEWRGADGGGSALVRCIALATGRRPVGSLVPVHSEDDGPATAALTVRLRRGAFAGTAVVEAVPQGWWWWIDDAGGSGAATLLCDLEELTAVGTRELLRCAVAAARGPLCGAQDVQLVHATRATAGRRRTAVPVLLLGDAAATIDPLASQGVEKALAAAEHAAVAIATGLREPTWWPRLLAVHTQWEHGLAAAHAATARAFHRGETRFVHAPFWRRRQQSTDDPAPAATSGPVVVARAVRFAPVLVRSGDRFVEEEGAVHGDRGESLGHLGHVPVAPLLRAFDAPRTLAAGVALAGRERRLYVLAPAAVHAAALELLRRGWLTAADGSPGNP